VNVDVDCSVETLEMRRNEVIVKHGKGRRPPVMAANRFS